MRDSAEFVRRCLTAVGYPAEEIPAVLSSSAFTVDGLEMRIAGEPGGVRFEFRLGAADDAALARLGSFASGRIVREDSVLALDPSDGSLFIWQRVGSSESDDAIVRSFESFAASAEWWNDRLGDGKPQDEVPEMVIRP